MAVCCRHVAGRRPLFLVGMMASGKSAVGAALAARLGGVFIDLDQRLERLSGHCVAELFAQSEATFRDVEASALRSLCAEPGFGGAGAVVATGGGAVISGANRALMSTVGRVCYLDVDVETLVKRLRAPDEVSRRPLLRGRDLRHELVKLQELRGQYYRSAEIIVNGASPIPEVVEEILGAL